MRRKIFPCRRISSKLYRYFTLKVTSFQGVQYEKEKIKV